jgi:hypothetical protein
MNIMRPAVLIALLLIAMILLAGCGQRVPPRNSTSSNPWNKTTPKATPVSSKITPVPTTTSPFIPATITPTGSTTATPAMVYRTEPPTPNATANLSLLDKKKLVFSYNRTAYTYTLANPPLLIDYTLTVPNITKTRVITDPVSGSDKTVSITYPNPNAWFELTVTDQETKRVILRSGYGGQYDVGYSKKIWIRYPGDYYLEGSLGGGGQWPNAGTASSTTRAPPRRVSAG